MSTTELLRGELERLFELEELKHLSEDLFGPDASRIASTGAKGGFARSLVELCESEDSVDALVDAMLASKRGVDDRVRGLLVSSRGADLAPGTVVAGFRVSKKLAEGGVGTVYLAEKKGDGGSVRAALKVVRTDLSRDKAAVKRFLSALRRAKRVEHRGLVSILAVGTLEDGRPYVATQFLEGQTLSARVGRVGPMHFNEARPILRSLLEGVSALHQAGLVHGDIKLENAFVVRPAAGGDAHGVFVDAVVDRLLDRAHGALPVFGTPKAIAPELARGKRYDARSEVYALGTLMYELLTGKTPFYGESAIEIIAQHLSATAPKASQVAPRGWVSKEVEEILEKALAKDPAARFQSAHELREALEAFARTSVRPPAGEQAELDEKAFKSAKKALLEKPDADDLAAALEKIAAPAGAWEKALAVYNDAVSAAKDNDSKKALLFRIARIHEHELGHTTDAEKAYARVLEIDGGDEIAQAGIEELRRQSGNIDGLIEVLLEKVDRASDSKERASILHEIATLYERDLGDADNAFVAWTSALGADPTDERTLREVARLAGSDAARWNEAATTLGGAVEDVQEPATRARIYTLLGEWYGEKLHRNDIAQGCFNKALESDPAFEAALDGTIAIYRRAQAWPDLVQLLLRRADAAGNPAKGRDFRAEAAELLAGKLNDSAQAADVLRRVLKDDPAHERASVALETMLLRDSQWSDLLALYEKKAGGQRGAEKADTLSAIAELYEDHLNDGAKAQTSYEAALAADPGNLGALKGLERVYAKQGRYDSLLANLKLQLTTVATARQRITLLERMGGLYEEEFVDADKAIASFEEILALDAAHENASAGLGRLYRAKGRFADLAALLEKQAKATASDTRRIELLLASAKVHVSDVQSPERALELVGKALEIDAKNVEALELSARLKSQLGDATAALSDVEKLVATESAPEKKAELLVRAGKILEERGDADRAIDQYKLALDTDPKSTQASQALRSIFASRGDARGAASLIERELATTDGAHAKARLLAELGSLERERLENPTKAREFFTKALELDATSTAALYGLGELAFADGNWPGVVRYFEPLLARTSSMPLERGKRVGLLCGDAFTKLGETEKAQRAYFDARAIAPEDREVLDRVAQALFASGDAESAAGLYKTLFKQYGEKLTGADRTKALAQYGEALRRAGELDEAEKVLKEALSHAPADRELFESLASVLDARGKSKDLFALLETRMEHAADDERFALLVRSGDLAAHKLKDKAKAAKAFVTALELRADDRNLLVKLMNAYSESKDWSKLLEIVLRIAELVTEPKQLAKYYATAGAISHFELSRLDEAADYYEQALSEDATHAPAWKGLVDVLTKGQSWDRLADAYRAQADRLDKTATPEERAALYDAFGELLRDKLKNPSAAIEAFEKAQALDSENRKRAELLADVYASDSKRHFEKAVGVHEALLSHSPYRAESYQALRKIYDDNGDTDGVFLAVQALANLGMAEPDEQALYKSKRATAALSSPSKLAEDVITKHLRHPDEEPLLTNVFAAIAPAVIAQRGQALATFGTDASKKVDGNKAAVRLLKDAASMLGVALPDAFERANDAGGISILASNPLALGLGKAAISGEASQALAFVAARQVAYLRPGYIVRQIVPNGAALRSWLLAAIRMSTPNFPVSPELEAQVEAGLVSIETTLTGPQQELLLAQVGKLLHDAPELNLKRWALGVDLMADRAGLLFANDLETALGVVKASAEESSAVTQKDRLKELTTFGVSEHYRSLRKKLGIGA